MKRDRSQLVVAFGEGAEGRRLREIIDRAAERAGRPVSVWARETLLAAAGGIAVALVATELPPTFMCPHCGARLGPPWPFPTCGGCGGSLVCSRGAHAIRASCPETPGTPCVAIAIGLSVSSRPG